MEMDRQRVLNVCLSLKCIYFVCDHFGRKKTHYLPNFLK